ncbi:BppU family phage baseplate upper protein [Clostridium botulinum]|uniref:BppU family phage baseplate upper protein n=1 Tax=Clostridium botulinum TaxID=1491 RepID=UPI0006A497B3|nr:BppU family phage baseplate upper protein [Clostridium botulinum]KOC32554.1 hypothetical protein ADU81_11145 [Clostridium botulinum]
MEKVFNLNIDTKDKKIMNVTGIKQFDNNSVLYINITQNSVSFDLTDCTIRLNFLKEDEEVLLYMADIIDAKKGKIKIKLSTQVLKDPGSIKCDLSIFDKNIMKITSLDFTMQVEKSIYSNEYYLQRADFDIVQSMHIEEEKRLKNERDRIAAEDKRATAETTRVNQENTREDNEKKRIEAEKKRATAENTRADNELGRITAECGRSTEEKKREAAEATRINQENNRIAAEKTRQAEYIKNKNLVDNFSVCQVYDPKVNYKKFNRVVFNGSTYECLKDCKEIDPNNKDNWICIAEKGNGNMSTSTYDKNNNGKVDVAEVAESVEWNNVKNKPGIVNSINGQTGTINIDYVPYEDFLEATKVPIKSNLEVDRKSLTINPLDTFNYTGSIPTAKKKLTTISSGEEVFNPYAAIQIKDNVANNKDIKDVVMDLLKGSDKK